MDKMQAFLKRGFSGLCERNASHDAAHDVTFGVSGSEQEAS
jgi:hypothetical protein